MNFFKYVSLSILMLSLMTNVNTQCMETPKDIATDFIDLNNPTMVKDTLISIAHKLTISTSNFEKCDGLEMFFDIVTKTEQGFDEAESACLACFASTHNGVKSKALKLLKALILKDHAVDNGLNIAITILNMPQDYNEQNSSKIELKYYAHEILHEIICNKRTNRIPKVIMITILNKYYNGMRSERSKQEQEIVNTIFKLTQLTDTIATEAGTTTSEE